MTVIASDFPYQSNYMEVMGAKIHYIDENNNPDENQTTFVCVHGNPSSGYLWRHVITHLLPHGRVIAPDLIGFGKSDQPDIDYRVLTHAQYFDTFIKKLGLRNIVFVLHDWGAALGLAYARRHEDEVKGLVFMEGIISPKKWDFGNLFSRLIFRAMRHPKLGKWMVIKHNFFVAYILLLLGTKRTLNKEEKNYYRGPFLKKASRKPVYVFPNEIPINGKPEDVYQMVQKNHQWMQENTLPKLLLWVKPGVLVKPHNLKEMQDQYPNLETVFLGNSSRFLKESHYVQEDFPNEIGNAIVRWFNRFK